MGYYRDRFVLDSSDKILAKFRLYEFSKVELHIVSSKHAMCSLLMNKTQGSAVGAQQCCAPTTYIDNYFSGSPSMTSPLQDNCSTECPNLVALLDICAKTQYATHPQFEIAPSLSLGRMTRLLLRFAPLIAQHSDRQTVTFGQPEEFYPYDCRQPRLTSLRRTYQYLPNISQSGDYNYDV